MKELFQFFIMSVGHFTYLAYICWRESLQCMKQFRHMQIYLFIYFPKFFNPIYPRFYFSCKITGMFTAVLQN